jgi:predicted ThiF/HesA family dinucleotide-utilizing enzyme
MFGVASDLGWGPAPVNNKPWTNNENIATLIDHLSLRLTAGQLSTQAKDIIRNFVAQPIASISTHATACTVTTAGNHRLLTGDVVVISGVNGGTFGGTANALNSSTTTRTVTVTSPTTFTIPLSCTVAPTSVAVAHVSVVPYNNATTTTPSAPSTTHMRDRLRAIVHLILTSADFTIQR